METIEIIGYQQKIKIDGIGELVARIDTGAKMSSIHATDIDINGKDVTFDHYGQEMTCRLVGHKTIKNAHGTQERPVCRLRIKFKNQKRTIRVTLTDRSDMSFPFILGRNALRNVAILPTS